MPFKTINDVTMHYRDQGQGMVLVLLHGFPHDSRIWDAQITELSKRFRVVAPDLRGFGQTQSANPFSIRSLADDIHTLLKALDILPCVLGGLSMGGYIALEFVNRYPYDLLGLMLLDTKAESDNDAAKDGRKKIIELVRSKGAGAVADQMLPKQLAPATPQAQPAIAAALRSIMESQSPIAMEHASNAMMNRSDHVKNLRLISVPTLIIVGDEDQLTPPTMARSMHTAIQHSTLSIIKSAGHLSPMEQPAQVNEAILDFLTNLNR